MTQQDFEPEWIWGDNASRVVYAQGYGSGHTVIFSFTLDPDQPTSLASRICYFFHDLDEETFADASAMRNALWDAIRSVWSQILMSPAISQLDTVFEIDNLASNIESVVWKAHSHPLFQHFVKFLADSPRMLTHFHVDFILTYAAASTQAVPGTTNIDFSSLVRYEQLGGHGCATRVRLLNDNTGRFFVFKGIDFRTFLRYADYGRNEALQHQSQGWHRSNEILANMPPHPNILPPPTHLVSLRYPVGSVPVICGNLQPLYEGGDLRSRINAANKQHTRLPLALKARWCVDMAAAIAHVHRVARTYHMDIKPGNFIINKHGNLVLCDWDQTDSPATTLAPEADGTWDVSTEGGDIPRPQFKYDKYQGNQRRNVAENALGDAPWHTWNVFPVWSVAHPLAVELIEVFSLGRTIWMLLRQSMEFKDVSHPNDILVDWEGAGDIPDSWRKFVDLCMSQNPNDRPDILQVKQFWEEEQNRFIG
jgi:hypothetical protein